MKVIFGVCGAILVAALVLFALKFSPRENHFGKPFTGLPPAAIPDIIAKPDAFLGKPVTIHGRLQRQCPATGCWFF